MVIFGLTFLAGRKEMNSRCGRPSSVVADCSRTEDDTAAGRTRGERRKLVGCLPWWGWGRIPARPSCGAAPPRTGASRRRHFAGSHGQTRPWLTHQDHSRTLRHIVFHAHTVYQGARTAIPILLTRKQAHRGQGPSPGCKTPKGQTWVQTQALTLLAGI